MKWFVNLGMQFKSKLSKSNPTQDLIDLKKGRQLYLASKFHDAILHLDVAVSSGFDISVYELRAKCFQKLDYHYKAIEDFDKVIEDNPLKFLNYYRRAISKNAVFDLQGQIEDLHNCIYYYKKSKNIKSNILKNLERDLLTAENYVDGIKSNITSIHNVSYVEIKNLISDCLIQIKRIKIRTRRFNSQRNRKILLES